MYRRWSSVTNLVAAPLDRGRSYFTIQTDGDLKQDLIDALFTHQQATRGTTYSERRFRKRLALGLENREYSWHRAISCRATPGSDDKCAAGCRGSLAGHDDSFTLHPRRIGTHKCAAGRHSYWRDALSLIQTLGPGTCRRALVGGSGRFPSPPAKRRKERRAAMLVGLVSLSVFGLSMSWSSRPKMLRISAGAAQCFRTSEDWGVDSAISRLRGPAMVAQDQA